MSHMKKNYIPSCEFYILGHSTILHLLVIKRFIVTNDVQLRITPIIG